MIGKIILYVLSLLSTLSVCESVFYLYDRVHNRAIRYDFTDAGNIYYTSDNFHSTTSYYNKFDQLKNNSTSVNRSATILMKLRTKSLPNIKL